MARKPRGKDDPDAPMTAIIGAIGFFALFLIVVALQALFYHVEKSQMERKKSIRVQLLLRTAQSEQQQQLYTYRWVSQPQGVVAIPIDRAMQLTAAQLRQQASTQPLKNASAKAGAQ